MSDSMYRTCYCSQCYRTFVATYDPERRTYLLTCPAGCIPSAPIMAIYIYGWLLAKMPEAQVVALRPIIAAARRAAGEACLIDEGDLVARIFLG